MANNFFNSSGNPVTASQGSSAVMRAEFASVEDGFDKLPALTGNGGKIVAVNSGGTALEAVSGTGTGVPVRATSPTLVTPTLGVASATSINGTSIPSSATLLVNGGALGTPSSGTVTNLTGTASININGTVGATTPNTGAFTTFTASGTGYFGQALLLGSDLNWGSGGNAGTIGYNPSTNVMKFYTASNERLAITSDGRLYGTALHNNNGSLTGNTNQYIASGTYTPTITSITNISNSPAPQPADGMWIRVGNVVYVTGSVGITLTASGAFSIGISLPIAHNITSSQSILGCASTLDNRGYGGIYADPTNDRATVEGSLSSDLPTNVFYVFTYVLE